MKSVITNWNRGEHITLSNIARQLYFTGLRSLLVMSLVSLVLGGVLISICNSFNLAEDIISKVLILTIIQHVGPLLIMIILIGRSGTAIAAELGNMQITHEIDSLEVMGIDVLHYIVAPRIIGMVISIFCLDVFFILVGTMGGAVAMVNVVANFSLSKFYQTFFNNIQVAHLLDNILKTIGFGAIISTVSCYQGLQVQRSLTEVPQMTTLAVARSIISCFILYAYITIIFLLI
jgi:phospholipid/cholesterol/gamma-HCH transport system permease protein